MTKPMDIVLKVEKALLGEVIDKLDGMPGIAEIGLKLKGPTEKKAKSKVINRPDSRDVVLAVLQRGPANNKELRAAFEHVGFNNSTAYATIRKLCVEGTIEAFPNRPDFFRLKGRAVKHHAAPALPAPAKKKHHEPGLPRPKGRQMNDVILGKMHEMNGSKIGRAILKETAEKAGFKAKGVDARLHDLRAKGLIRVAEPGVYELTAKGKQQIAQGAEVNA